LVTSITKHILGETGWFFGKWRKTIESNENYI